MKLSRLAEQSVWITALVSSTVQGAQLREDWEEPAGAVILEGTTLNTFIGGPTTVIDIPNAVFTWVKQGFTTTWSPSSKLISQEVIVSGETTTVVLPGTTTDITLSGGTTIDLSIPGVTTTVTIGDYPQDIVHPGTGTTVTVTGATTVHFEVTDVSTDLLYAGTTVTLTMPSLPGPNGFVKRGATTTSAGAAGDPKAADKLEARAGRPIANLQEIYSRWAQFTTSVTVDGTTIVISLDASGTTVSLEGTEVSLTLDGITLDQPLEPAEDLVIPTHYPMTCNPELSTVSGEEEVQLRVLFGTEYGESTYAEHIADYADELVSQMWMISNDALNLGGLTFTSLFTEVDITGILGLASAAPVYNCFLSSMWANDLDSAYDGHVKRDTPSEEETAKLILLFSRHEDGGNGYDLVELLIDETEELINEIRELGTEAVAMDGSAGGAVFSKLNAQHLLAFAKDVPVYSEGLSDAIEVALAEYRETGSSDTGVSVANDLGEQPQSQSKSQSQKPSQSTTKSSTSVSSGQVVTLVEPVTTLSTTNTYTTMFTLSTNYLNETTVSPTTLVSTSIFKVVKPISTIHSTRTIPIESVSRGYALMAASDATQVSEETLTEMVRIAVSEANGDMDITTSESSVVTHTVRQVTVEDTADIRVDRITTTVSPTMIQDPAPGTTLHTTVVQAASADSDTSNNTGIKMAYFTKTQNGSTRVFSLAVQTVDEAAKRNACIWGSLLGLIVYFL